jgi:hypothetical protein
LNRINFESDLKNEMHNAFSDLGFRIPIRTKIDEMLLDYLTIHKKLVHQIPRRVFISPDLKEKLNKYEKRKVVEIIKGKLEIGYDVNFFQSKKLFQTKFHDHLLYEWNVFHFHLSTEKEKKSNFMKQTDQLLFAYIDEKCAILLDVDIHKEGIFGDEKWLEILDKYFPDVLEPYLTNNIIDISPNVTSIGRQTLWNYGFSLGLTKVNGKIIRSPGIGRMTSGHSVLVAKTCNEILRWLHTVTNHFEKYYINICTFYGLNENKVDFKLVFGNTTLELIEAKTKKRILTYPHIFNFDENLKRK